MALEDFAVPPADFAAGVVVLVSAVACFEFGTEEVAETLDKDIEDGVVEDGMVARAEAGTARPFVLSGSLDLRPLFSCSLAFALACAFCEVEEAPVPAALDDVLVAEGINEAREGDSRASWSNSGAKVADAALVAACSSFLSFEAACRAPDVVSEAEDEAEDELEAALGEATPTCPFDSFFEALMMLQRCARGSKGCARVGCGAGACGRREEGFVEGALGG